MRKQRQNFGPVAQNKTFLCFKFDFAKQPFLNSKVNFEWIPILNNSPVPLPNTLPSGIACSKNAESS